MTYFQSYTRQELSELLLTWDLADEDPEKKQKRSVWRAKQLFQWVYQRHVMDYDQMSDVSKVLREKLKQELPFYHLTEAKSFTALDGTHKFLWTLHDQKTIESVIIPAALQEKDEVDEEDEVSPQKVTPSDFAGKKTNAPLKTPTWKRLTACISSQVGCAMACKFCLTGVQGLDRSLETHEVVAQIHELRKRAPITNIVFMGMGEPLHNFEAITKACKIFLDEFGFKFSKRKVTVSTSGLVPQIEKLGQTVDVSLAISLNSSTDEQRSQIMPVNKKWNIQALLKACREYPVGSFRRITFEYVLLKDFNDTLEDAKRVAALLRGIPSKVNLIPFNEHSGSEFKRPSDDTVRAFQKVLLDRGYTATVRISRGRDISAACGQLRSLFGSARGTDKHKDAEYRQGAASA